MTTAQRLFIGTAGGCTFALALAATAAFGSDGAVPAKPLDPNAVRIADLIDAVECVPHESDAGSDVDAHRAIAAGDADLAAGNCVRAAADYEMAIGAEPAGTDALFHHIIAELAIRKSTGDPGVAARAGEAAYRDADAATGAAPQNPVFLLLRAETRQGLIAAHVRGKSAFGLRKYVQSELEKSYDDLTNAIAAAPTYGQAYAARWMIDERRHDEEQATFDLAKAQRLDPQAAERVRFNEERNERQEAANEERRERRLMAAAEAMMGFAVATGGIEFGPGGYIRR